VVFGSSMARFDTSEEVAIVACRGMLS